MKKTPPGMNALLRSETFLLLPARHGSKIHAEVNSPRWKMHRRQPNCWTLLNVLE